MRGLKTVFLLCGALTVGPAGPALAENVYPSFTNGVSLLSGQVTKFDFTVTAADTVYFLFTSDNVGDAFILTPAQFSVFQGGGNFTTLGGFRNQSGRQTISLSPGSYTVGVKSTGETPLDYGFRIITATNIQAVRAADTIQVLPGQRTATPFSVNPGETLIFASVGEGLQAFILTPGEANKFAAGLQFTPVGGAQIFTDLQTGSASGELTLNQGQYVLGYRNPTQVQRPATFVIGPKKPDFTGGGPVNPPSDVVPFFDAATDEGVGGTFLNDVFRTRFNNSKASLAPSFLVSGCNTGQFVRIYAAGKLIAEGVAGGPQLTLKAKGNSKLDDGDYPITASQFNGQTESDRTQFLMLTVDTTAPTPPSTPDLTPESDTGPSPDDNITGASQLTFTGTSEPLARVLMTVNGKGANASSVQADENGTWTFTLTAPKPGKVKFGAVQMDTAGNVSKVSAPLEVQLLKPPTAPAKPDLIKTDKGKTVGGVLQTTNPAPTFTGKAGKGNTITLTIDGVEVQSVIVDDKGVWSLALSQPMTLGQHTATVRQADLAGGISAESKPLSLRVNSPQ